MKKKLVIVDGHNLAHRALHKFGGLTNERGVSTGVLFGFVYILRPLIATHGPDQLVVTFDGGRSPYRKKLLPGYKMRESLLGSDRDSFDNQISLLNVLLPALNVSVVHGKGIEADDIIYKLVRNNPGMYITIVSSDKDFIPILSPTVKVFNPFKNKLITINNCQEIYGYEYDEFLDYLILKGDKSDRIPGVTGLGEKRIREFMDEYGSIEEWLDSEDKGKWVKYDIEKSYKRNKSLISLPRYFREAGKYETYTTTPPNWDDSKIHEICFKYNIKKFLAKSFLKPFNELSDGI